MLKKILPLLIIFSLLAAGCTPNKTTDTNSSKTNTSNGDKPTIVATLFPQFDFARQIVGDKADVTLLLPPGVESHSYDPTPADIIKINNADLFIYTGYYMESWADKIIKGLDDNKVTVLDVSKNIHLMTPNNDESHVVTEQKEGEEHNHKADPHIWTDPNNAAIMVENILEEICTIDKDNAEFYRSNAKKYQGELQKLDKEFVNVVSKGSGREIIFGGKNAFNYFLERYNIPFEGAYPSCANEGDPSVKVIADLIDEVKSKKIPVIYYEELSTPKVAESIRAETGAKLLLLHSAHNVSKEDFDKGITYLSIMQNNLTNLKDGLN